MPKFLIKDATTAWRYLHGIICVYKPPGMIYESVIRDIKSKLCSDLNTMSYREPQTVVQFRRIEDVNNKAKSSNKSNSKPLHDYGKEVVTRINDGPDIIEVIKGQSYADHPLVVGPRYQRQDLKMVSAHGLGHDSSGVTLFGLMSDGIKQIERINSCRWMRAYIVSGRFGTATDNQFHTGKIIDKSTYHNVKRYLLDRLLSSSQASHQRLMFHAAGVQLNSERAYELASQGLIRPDNNTVPIVYSLKCVKFDLPDFDIEVQVVNEQEDYLKTLIHEFGLRLRSAATCTKIRCVKYGPFNLDHALLRKHWDLENIITNLSQSAQVLKTVNTWVRDPIITDVRGKVSSPICDAL